MHLRSPITICLALTAIIALAWIAEMTFALLPGTGSDPTARAGV